MPGPRSTKRSRMRPPTSRARTETGWPPEWRWAFSSRFANARSSWAASARTGGRSASIATLKASGGQAEVVDRGAHDLLDRAPLGVRLGGVGLQAREVEQVVDQPREAARLVGHRRGELGALRRSVRLGECSASAVVRIAVSGERRSCETERSSAVLITSLRRSAAVSTTSACSASRSSAAASSASSAGAIAHLHAPQHGLRRAGGQHERADLARALAQREDDAALAGVDRAQLDRGAGEPERLREPRADRRQRLLQPPAAQQQPRHLGRQVGLLAALVGLRARACGRARPASSPRRRRGRRRPGATQFSPVAIVKRPVGGMWKKLNASALATRGRQRQPRAPDRRHHQHDEQVDDAEREHRRDVVERVDQQRGQRDADRRGHDSDEQRRAALEHVR